VDIEITSTAQGQRYSGVWLPGTDGYYLWANADWQHFLAKWQEVSAQGLRLVDLDVVPGSGAQSPVPEMAPSYGGMAEAFANANEDGMGGSGAALAAGEAGVGFGSITGEDFGAVMDRSGMPGEGGGSVGSFVTGTASQGFGGGASQADRSVGSGESGEMEAELVMEGFGGGSAG